MEWENYDDFEKKYGSDTNPENYILRMRVWMTYDSLGMLLMKGLADKDILYNSQASYMVVYTWNKYKEILLENRRLYSGNDAWIGYEYLADILLKMKQQNDPNWNLDMATPQYEDTWRTKATEQT